jgi:hypothetical protein
MERTAPLASKSAAPEEPTRWSLVMAAASASPEEARAALEELCRLYWRPLWRFAKSRFQLSDTDAEDLVQGFLADAVRRDLVAHADRARGRFRSFFFNALQNYGLNVVRRNHAKKRGGGAHDISATLTSEIDALDGQGATRHEETATKEADHEWALLTLQTALKQVEQGFVQRGIGDRFRVLKAIALDDLPVEDRMAAIAPFGWNEKRLAVEVFRFRQRLKEAFSRVVRATVTTAEDELEECRYLLKLLA